MLPYFLLIWSSFALENSLDTATKYLESGNYLMAEATLITADPSINPQLAGQLLSDLAIGMNAVSSKQQFIENTLLPSSVWKTSAHLALTNLALYQKDWQSLEKNLQALFSGTHQLDKSLRFRLLYHLARHTKLEIGNLSLPSDEQSWVEACRTTPPNRTWPTDTRASVPFIFQFGHLLEQREAFSLPASIPNNPQDQFFGNIIKTRNFLNEGDTHNAAIAINQMMKHVKTVPAPFVKVFFYQLLLEYFQRQGETQSAATTASNLAIVRKKAFIPIQSWPERAQLLQLQRTLEAPAASTQVAAKPDPSAPKPQATELSETTSEPKQVEAESIQPQSEIVTQATEPTAAEPQPVVETPEQPEAEPKSVDVESTNLPPGSIEEVKETATTTTVTQPAVTQMPSDSVPDQPTETIDIENSINSVNRELVQPEPQTEDPNLALGRAMMEDGDLLMAEAQFMTVTPRTKDVVPLGMDLATLAIQAGNQDTKERFFRDYLNRQDAWRGVALTILSAFSAKKLDWVAFERYAAALVEEYSPLTGQGKFPLLYYLARFTPNQPTQLRPHDALWFQASRDLNAFSVWPKLATDSLPYSIRNGSLLDALNPFDIPSLPENPSPQDVYFQSLLKIRAALNAADLNQAAQELNQIASLPNKTVAYQWRQLHQALAREYFEKRNEPEKAAIAAKNEALFSNWTVLPIQAFPSRAEQVNTLLTQASAERLDPVVSKPLETTSPAVASPEQSAPVVMPTLSQSSKWQELERALMAGNTNLEITIRGKDTPTTYDRIYKAYLLGHLYLKKGRYQSAYERLNLAESLVRDFPFPVLESKVMLAMADYYQYERNRQQADWYRIAAVQIWNEPLNLPIFASIDTDIRREPFLELIDQGLKTASQKGTIHSLIYFSELKALLHLREKAYQAQVLGENSALGQQLLDVGKKLNNMIDDLATQADPSVTPRRFNDTQKLWQGLWNQTYPYFRDEQVPGLKSIQEAIGAEERLLVFLEGNLFFGVLIISKDQNFAVGLGNKANFFRLSDQERFDFLEGRLGPVWNYTGSLTVKLSNSFKNQSMLDQLRNRMTNPEKLRLVYSLKSALLQPQDSACSSTFGFFPNQTSQSLLGEPNNQTQMLWGKEATYNQLIGNLETRQRAILAGNLALTQQGLVFQPEGVNLLLQELPQYQPQLCSLTLISSSGPSFWEMLEELALIQVRSGTAIQVRYHWDGNITPVPDRHFQILQSPQP